MWQKFQGKQNKTLRVITAYRPVEPKTNGPFKVFAQHQTYFNQSGRRTNPREAILIDLQADICKWIKDGEHIILMMDCNEDVRSPRITQFLEDTGLQEPILDKYGRERAPHTYIDGSDPIDGIFTSHEIEIVEGGYTSFEDGVQGLRPDHRCLWIDIREVDVFGQTMPGRMKFQGRRVKSKDPRTRAKFNKEYKKFIVQHKLAKNIYEMENAISYPASPAQIQECNKIAALRQKGIMYADRRCRKLRFGGGNKHLRVQTATSYVANIQ